MSTDNKQLIPTNDDEVPSLELTDARIYKLACIGTPVDEMADFFEVTEDEINARFAKVLKRGAAKHRINVRMNVNYSNSRGSPLILNKTNEKLGKSKTEVNEFMDKTSDEIREFLKRALSELDSDTE